MRVPEELPYYHDQEPTETNADTPRPIADQLQAIHAHLAQLPTTRRNVITYNEELVTILKRLEALIPTVASLEEQPQPPQEEPGHEAEPQDPRYKDFSVAVFSASSQANQQAIANGHEMGVILAQHFMKARNGGYPVGGMGALATGFRETSQELDVPDEDIRQRFVGVNFSEAAIGPHMAQSRGQIEGITNLPKDSLAERAGELIQGADALVVTEGGLGTLLETLVAAQDEWFRQSDSSKGLARKPIIIIDSSHSVVDTLMTAEMRTPGRTISPDERQDPTIARLGNRALGSLNSLEHDHIFILSGHTVQDAEGRTVVANLANDPKMRNQVEMLLELYYLEHKGDELDDTARQYLAEYKERLLGEDSPEKVMTLKRYLQAQDEYTEGAGI